MNKKKTKINIILILIVIFLIVTALMVRFEFNPISYLLGGMGDDTETKDVSVNYNGVYRYKESLNKSYKLLNGCTLSYYDYYIIVLNNNYYRYKSTCVGTFFLDEGDVSSLDFGQTLEKNIVIKFNGKEYLKNDYISSVVEGNYFKTDLESYGKLYADTYHILMRESQLPGKEYSFTNISLDAGNANFPIAFKVLDEELFELIVYGARNVVLYRYNVTNMYELPLFNGFGRNLAIVEPIVNKVRYAYTFKAINTDGVVYDLKNKFPITIDNVTLTYEDSIYIKYSATENVYILLVSKDRKFCEESNESKDVAYYVFHIKYDYVTKNFNNPKFIKKVYKNEGCKYVDELMGD